jgi:hypothetical protein
VTYRRDPSEQWSWVFCERMEPQVVDNFVNNSDNCLRNNAVNFEMLGDSNGRGLTQRGNTTPARTSKETPSGRLTECKTAIVNCATARTGLAVINVALSLPGSRKD